MEEHDTVEARQATHSRKTEVRLYGLSADALSGVAEDVLPLYLDASTDWQIEAKAVPGGLGLSYQGARARSFDDLVKLGAISRASIQAETSTINEDKLVAALLPVLKDQIMSQVSTTLSTIIEESVQRGVQAAVGMSI